MPRYIEIRDRIRGGDLIALTHTSWASWYDLQVQFVRLGTQSEYCHVGQVWPVAGRLFVIESVTPMVRLVPLSHFAAEGFYWIPLEAPMSDAELEHALAQLGRGAYSKWQAILGGLRKLRIGADALWQCAEFVIANRRLSGIDLGPKATPSAVVLAAQQAGAPVYFIQGH